MSTWTHVVGAIRVDGLPHLNNEIFTSEKLRKIMGPVSTFHQPNDKTKLPCGSEGSLQYEIIEYYKGIPWVIIPIWGDLRDYYDLAKIRRWWFRLLRGFGKPYIIRDCVLTATVENGDTIVLTKDKE
jgi:hypothetical protein